MGAWGYGSDENDDTYDILGMSIAQRVGGVQLTAKGRKQAQKDFATIEPKTPGVVVWFVKQGINVPKTIMKKTIRTLEKEDPDTDECSYKYEVSYREVRRPDHHRRSP